MTATEREGCPVPTLLQVACLAYWAALHQVRDFMAAVYPAVAASAFLGAFLLALRGIA